eukprot:CAMPEP_0180138634 /NCGR_PEP_ID=MMETSP0986-20121125/13019_1 /TAXON_ID=697907 /ORGANISM="non described non described, Strain CCMP2293" /LENGTH=64 /DNA_ID=CAMNT_0022080513 /DNA_START=344 /DNA_END=538 /DNA_ORIENTATION=+
MAGLGVGGHVVGVQRELAGLLAARGVPLRRVDLLLVEHDDRDVRGDEAVDDAGHDALGELEFFE